MSKIEYDTERICNELIKDFGLDLKGLTVYTEAASGSYLYTPIIAALAGADTVYAQTKDSRYAQADDVILKTQDVTKSLGLSDKVKCIKNRNHQYLEKADIVTNSGFVRPIDKDLISSLKATAVIPLMWETWEFIPEQIDLDYCKEKEILVMGTDESRPPCDMSNFIGLLGLKLLFDLKYDGGKVLLLGNSPSPGEEIVKRLRLNGVDVTWFSNDNRGDHLYSNFKDFFLKNGKEYEILILAEHEQRFEILGSEGLIGFDEIKKLNPNIRIGVISGNVSASELAESELYYFPTHIAGVGQMSYQPYMLGPRPVLTLYSAGLKVGQIMARARLRGLSPKETALEAINKSPAMDFNGEMSWL